MAHESFRVRMLREMGTSGDAVTFWKPQNTLKTPPFNLILSKIAKHLIFWGRSNSSSKKTYKFLPKT
jgi:hypothetical protein